MTQRAVKVVDWVFFVKVQPIEKHALKLRQHLLMWRFLWMIVFVLRAILCHLRLPDVNLARQAASRWKLVTVTVSYVHWAPGVMQQEQPHLLSCLPCIAGSTTAFQGAWNEDSCIRPRSGQDFLCTSGQVCTLQIEGFQLRDGHRLSITSNTKLVVWPQVGSEHCSGRNVSNQ